MLILGAGRRASLTQIGVGRDSSVPGVSYKSKFVVVIEFVWVQLLIPVRGGVFDRLYIEQAPHNAATCRFWYMDEQGAMLVEAALVARPALQNPVDVPSLVLWGVGQQHLPL